VAIRDPLAGVPDSAIRAIERVDRPLESAPGDPDTGDARYVIRAYVLHASRLRGFALSMVHDPDAADDLVSEAFTRLVAEVYAGRTPIQRCHPDPVTSRPPGCPGRFRNTVRFEPKHFSAWAPYCRAEAALASAARNESAEASGTRRQREMFGFSSGSSLSICLMLTSSTGISAVRQPWMN